MITIPLQQRLLELVLKNTHPDDGKPISVEDLEQILLDDAKQSVELVLRGKLNKFSSALLSPGQYASILRELGAVEYEGDGYNWCEHTNGWNWGYFIFYVFQGRFFIQTGEGYASGTSFEPCEKPEKWW